MTTSQFGSHEWLMKRESFPPDEPSITTASSTMKKKVWWRRDVASSGELSSASSGEMRLPVYSTIRAPSGTSRVAKTPRPWIFDRRLMMGASFIVAGALTSAASGLQGRSHDDDGLARLGRRLEIDPARERPVVAPLGIAEHLDDLPDAQAGLLAGLLDAGVLRRARRRIDAQAGVLFEERRERVLEARRRPLVLGGRAPGDHCGRCGPVATRERLDQLEHRVAHEHREAALVAGDVRLGTGQDALPLVEQARVDRPDDGPQEDFDLLDRRRLRGSRHGLHERL